MRLFKKSLSRTVGLGLLTLIVLCYALVNIVGVSSYDVYVLLGISGLLVIALAAAGFVFAIILHIIKRLINSFDKTE